MPATPAPRGSIARRHHDDAELRDRRARERGPRCKGAQEPRHHPAAATITAGPAATTTSTAASLSFASSEPGSFECALGAAAFAPCTSPKSYAGLPLGDHSLPQGNQYNHGFQVYGGDGTTIRDVSVRNVFGDFVNTAASGARSIGGDVRTGQMPRNVRIQRLPGTTAQRMCISFSAGIGMWLEDSSLSDCDHAGVGLEPDWFKRADARRPHPAQHQQRVQPRMPTGRPLRSCGSHLKLIDTRSGEADRSVRGGGRGGFAGRMWRRRRREPRAAPGQRARHAEPRRLHDDDRQPVPPDVRRHPLGVPRDRHSGRAREDRRAGHRPDEEDRQRHHRAWCATP